MEAADTVEGFLTNSTTGHLLAFDQDQDAEKNAQFLSEAVAKEGKQSSFTFIESNFRYLKKFLRLHGIEEVDGILADLGVSSHQFDEPSRGFTTRAEGDLDMRMDQAAGKSARNVVNEYEERDLIHILSAYGEVKNARTLAGEIVASFRMNDRNSKRVRKLKEIALKNAPRGRGHEVPSSGISGD